VLLLPSIHDRTKLQQMWRFPRSSEAKLCLGYGIPHCERQSVRGAVMRLHFNNLGHLSKVLDGGVHKSFATAVFHKTECA